MTSIAYNIKYSSYDYTDTLIKANDTAIDSDPDLENEATTFIFKDDSKLRLSSFDDSIKIL